MKSSIDVRRVTTVTTGDFIDVLRRSGLALRRPVADEKRIATMLEKASLLVAAYDIEEGSKLVGIARSLTDFSYCCYLSDLAVDKAYQGRGIGKRLIEETRKAAGPQSMCLLLSAPAAMTYYEKIGMPKAENAFIYEREF